MKKPKEFGKNKSFETVNKFLALRTISRVLKEQLYMCSYLTVL